MSWSVESNNYDDEEDEVGEKLKRDNFLSCEIYFLAMRILRRRGEIKKNKFPSCEIYFPAVMMMKSIRRN